VGNDGGAWPETFADIRSGYRYMRQHAEQHHLDLRNLVVMGHSAGGQLALALAAYEPTVRSVVSLAGVVDLRRAYQLHLSHDAVVEFLRGTPDEVPDHYREADPMQLSIPRAQQWLICATEDEDVPPDLTRVYVAAKQKHSGAQKEDVHLIEIAGATHMDLIDPRSRAWKQVQATVLQLLA
jgi:acetyl esterase/lipase